MVYEICKTKTICEGGSEIIEDSASMNGEEINAMKRHGGCGGYQPTYKRDGMKISCEFKQVPDENIEKKQILSPEKVHAILKRISDSDCIAMGLDPKWARPDWMIITRLPVPPPQVRPSIMMDAVHRGEDDLTHKLADIIKYNNDLRKKELSGSPPHIIQELTSIVQFHVAAYMNNEIPGQPQVIKRIYIFLIIFLRQHRNLVDQLNQ